jgi:hypothetical protein
MRRYSVLLLYPDYIAETFGQETFLAHVEAMNPGLAVGEAQRLASSCNNDNPPEDFFPLLVTLGHIEDLRQ